MKFLFKDKGYKEESLISAMLCILSDGDGHVLQELIELSAPLWGECEVSVVRSLDRVIMATTANEKRRVELEHVAKKVKKIDKKYHFLRNEENGMFFRQNVNVIRVYPLNVKGGEPYFLMVEQAVSKAPAVTHVLQALSVAVRLYSLDKDMYEASFVEKRSGLRNREALIMKLEEEQKKGDYENYLVMFHIPKIADYVLKNGAEKENYLKSKLISIIKKYFSEIYDIGMSRFCVWEYAEKYEILSKAQDCLDEIMDVFPTVEFGCVMCPGTEVVYKAIYLCEKVCDVKWGDMVIVIRDMDSSFEHGVECERNPYMGNDTKYEDVTFADEKDFQKKSGTDKAEGHGEGSLKKRKKNRDKVKPGEKPKEEKKVEEQKEFTVDVDISDDMEGVEEDDE